MKTENKHSSFFCSLWWSECSVKGLFEGWIIPEDNVLSWSRCRVGGKSPLMNRLSHYYLMMCWSIKIPRWKAFMKLSIHAFWYCKRKEDPHLMSCPVRSTITSNLKLEEEAEEQTLEAMMRTWRARWKLEIKCISSSKGEFFQRSNGFMSKEWI